MNFLAGLERIVRQGEPLAMHTWLQLGGPAEYFAEPENVEQLLTLLKRCHEHEVPLRVLGRGSNVLVRDEGVRGMVIRLMAPAFGNISVEGTTVRAGGGATFGQVVTTAVYRGLAGLETLVAIPGTVGGALRGNASAHGNDLGQWTAAVTVATFTGELIHREREDLVFSYRQSNLDDLVVLETQFQLDEDDPHHLARRMQKHWIVRKANQPMGHHCVGCIFKNPRGANAGELIEAAGLKGTRIGGAVVSDRHPAFIIAEPECTSQDVLRLIDVIRAQVHGRTGVELELEIELW
jgi:UDP-N-acetylmuramate dehydrogenase